MAQKVKPNAIRLGITTTWSSRWFLNRNTRFFLEEDLMIREFIRERLKDAGIVSIDIERASETIRVSIQAARPGLIIGRGGKGIEEMKEKLLRNLKKLRVKNNIPTNFAFNVNVEELKRTEIAAAVMGQQIATDLERRQPYRKLMKRAIENAMQNRDIKGVKIKLSGRLNGAEISRTEWLAKGRMPLSTLRANIDYAEATSFNTYGTIGVKVWLYKGEIFDTKAKNKK
ncbi:30S ribosomal protein S3 [Candidatus Parcubacteria bacterium]|jgi:small subunit ribosomal protein S3|nr:MAG: 30S ribosomal protein S3 [Candidatus Parcubacteria bacterium]